MCTAMTARTDKGDIFFGRTMDFSYPLDPELYIIPKGFQWNNTVNTHKIKNLYSVMGIGQNLPPATLADGVNDMGFAAAALYFPDCAHYDPVVSEDSSRLSVAALELVNFLLSQCASVDEAVSLLHFIRIVGVQDPVTRSVAPLHWILADRSGKCLTAEKTESGLRLSDNPIGVLSNSPDFQWHMTNLRNYMNVTPSQRHSGEWGPVNLTPFGQGAGTFGLPGDYTPPSRFVRTAYLKSHTPIPSDRKKAVVTCFHIMESVSIPKGAVITNRAAPDYTQYTSFINLTGNEYFFKTYDNSRIVSARLAPDQDYGSGILSLGKLAKPIQFESCLFK